jgi:hypothetical protein
VIRAGVVMGMALLLSGLAAGFKVEIDRTVGGVGAQWCRPGNVSPTTSSTAVTAPSGWSGLLKSLSKLGSGGKPTKAGDFADS